MRKSEEYLEFLELFHFGFRGIVEEVDNVLNTLGLNRSHHRILYFIARAGHLPLASLVEILGISRQALHRPLKQLVDQGYAKTEQLESNKRVIILSLSREGVALEKQITGRQVELFREIEKKLSHERLEGWRETMELFSKNTAYDDLNLLLGRRKKSS